MPTSTLPFEVLFEFTNDTTDAATLQLTRGDDEFSSGGAMILLHGRESVSLVLNAGSTYHYTLKQHARKARISWVHQRLIIFANNHSRSLISRVRTWQDVQCSTTGLFAGNRVHGPLSWIPVEGITVTCLTPDGNCYSR
jgi:hypothetical protein